jgi:RNA polymerase sigma-70 factor (ECF subfamily)
MGARLSDRAEGSETLVPRKQEETRLIERAKQGDKRAIGELYQRHADVVYRYVYSRVMDVAVAEDLTAEVFLKALEGLSGYQVTDTPFLAWLYRIARARTIDFWRRQQRRQEASLPDTLPASGPEPEELVSSQSSWEMVQETLSQLTDDQQQVVLLRFVEELDLKEVAAVMGKTVGAVKALQHRALASMARLLDQRTGPGT